MHFSSGPNPVSSSAPYSASAVTVGIDPDILGRGLGSMGRRFSRRTRRLAVCPVWLQNRGRLWERALSAGVRGVTICFPFWAFWLDAVQQWRGICVCSSRLVEGPRNQRTRYEIRLVHLVSLVSRVEWRGRRRRWYWGLRSEVRLGSRALIDPHGKWLGPRSDSHKVRH